ncbi:MAG TPA: hypothetical protein VJS92_03370 [Candidatus Polarisedimenticolaceae bacterium]|nr:hypothetical protein [Candidatus Polarisedimenticolaceae bacterium]
MRNSKTLAVLAAFALLCAVAAPVAMAAAKTHEVKTEVVSVNMDSKMITIKDDKGENKTVPVLDSALASLKTVKAGDHVVLTCQDDDKGMHQGVSAIKVEMEHKKG